MRAARLTTPGEGTPLEVVEVPEPEPGPGEVLIDVDACAVCRTDLQLVDGDLAPRRLPIVPGHQAVGRIVSMGAGVDGWWEGDRVGVAWLAGTCGSCRFCETDRENLCDEARFTGWDRHGGYAERITADADFVFRVPEGPCDLDIAPLLCGGIIGYRALRVSGVEPGGRLGLFGFGASASLAIQVAVHWGCDVYVVTRSEADRSRAIDLGATWAGSYDEPVPCPLDAAVTFAPVGAAVVAALRALDKGGLVAVNAIHLDRIPAFDYDLLWWERQIRSVANFTRDDATEFLALASCVPIRTSADPYPLERAGEALDRLRSGDIAGTAVLTTSSR